ncbi:outer membrane protein OmpA-like peptidoglycan-associated protein [Rhizobium azibense]|uniref:Outer membrane protein OmpA-like peptidoglycan-associated protein n=1 Tax=Rhizobium azibense TaxID=1136135 RepID=A0A4R3QTY0_9HYPH|nr:OmpA family protein [Rhizobium azibense]TCU25798.1 outer membrane protein OmpA-like peptidoglycan-associated protein [Rhizobium azibense]
MGMKSRLFASAAFPLLSLSLAMSPAHAATAAGVSAVRPVSQVISGSYEVAQDAAPSDEEILKKKRKRPAEQPAEEQQPEAEPQQEAPQAEQEAPRRKQRKPAPQSEQAPEAQQAQPSEEQPRRKKRQASPEQAEPEPEQEQVAPEAAPQQQPAQNRERPRRKQREQQPAQQEVPQQDQAQPQADEPQQQTDEAQPEQQRPRKRQQQATEGEKQQATEGEKQQPAAKPGRKPVKEAQPEQQPAEDKAAVPKELPAPEKTPVPAESPAPEKPPVPAEPDEAQKPAEGGEEPLQQQGEQVPPAAPTGEQPTGDAQPTEQAIPAPEKVTPEELDRRKQIAEDPSKSNETVVLPVENGAAVLDSDKDADRTVGRGGRRERDRLRAAEQQVIAVPKSDADAQLAPEGQRRPPVKFEAVTSEEGRRLDRRPEFMSPEGARVERYEGDDNRTIIQFNNRIVVRSDDERRFLRDGERPLYEQLSRDRYRETIERPEGYRIVTIRNRYGDIIQRSRIDSRGREYVLYYSPELYDDPDRGYFEDPGADLPPMRLAIPVRDYIIDTSSNPDRDYYEFLSEPPVEPVERVYSLNEVKYSARIRDKVRRIDLDTITFATGSAEIPMSQARSLRKVADAMNEVLEKDQSETFLIEGHTDAVGSDESNLVLSDQRAESVANVLTDVYGIPPENLATQGYGERYLKVNVDGPEQENRRVTIRRVTALVRPVASNQ